MLRKVLGVLAFVSMFGFAVSISFAFYYFVLMLRNLKPEHKITANFLAPIAFFLPHLWNQSGNMARIKFLISILLCLLFLCAIALAFALAPRS